MRAHKVVILAVPGSAACDIVTAVQVLGRVPERRYEIEVCGQSPGVSFSGFGFSLVCERGLEALADADTVIVPGREDVSESIDLSALEGLKEAYRRGARIASLCTGSFTLAQAGLLDGRRATTHWHSASELEKRFPKVKVAPNVLYVDDGQVLTSAGATAGVDLCLHLIRRDHGEEVANQASRMLVASSHRSGGQAQFIARPLPPRRTRQLEPVIRWALENLSQDITTAVLAEKAGLTPRSLARRFQDEIGMPPHQWLIEQRIRKAQRMLETTDLPVQRIAADSGFGSPLACRTHFKRAVKMSPNAYRKQFATRLSSGPAQRPVLPHLVEQGTPG